MLGKGTVLGAVRCAVSSVVEHYLDTVGVTGSNPVSRTISPVAGTPTKANASAGPSVPAHLPGINYIYQALLSLTASLGALLGDAAPKSMALADVCSAEAGQRGHI